MNRLAQRSHRRADRQRGIVLYVAIIVLIAMTLAGLAMMRQLGAGTSIAGNIAFKENATSAADRGTEWARAWIAANRPLLDNDNFALGYHSSWDGGVDPTNFNWPLESFELPVVDVGNSAFIYVERLCALPGTSAIAPNQTCSDKAVGNGNHGGGGYPSVLPPTPPQPYFRVTTRVDGPRHTHSYI
ncbi:MAG: hypothetical protein M3Y67_03815, partial [Pseudomonadota bacterium]|nr:hypothetical protein [Pseudomonadota bacterium]